jgi:hypothetical protein
MSFAEPSNIIPNLYLSGVDVAAEKEILLKYEIKSVLVIGSELEPYHPEVCKFLT